MIFESKLSFQSSQLAAQQFVVVPHIPHCQTNAYFVATEGCQTTMQILNTSPAQQSTAEENCNT
jgi:hypothetical protein